MPTRKKIRRLRRVDDGKLFKFWQLASVEIKSVAGNGPAKAIETELGQMESDDGRRIYTDDYVAFFFEGEPHRPMRIYIPRGA